MASVSLSCLCDSISHDARITLSTSAINLPGLWILPKHAPKVLISEQSILNYTVQLVIFETDIFTQTVKSEFSKILCFEASNYREIRIANHGLCLSRNHLLIGMVYDGILTVVCWQSLISGNPALISGNLGDKKRCYNGPD